MRKVLKNIAWGLALVLLATFASFAGNILSKIAAKNTVEDLQQVLERE